MADNELFPLVDEAGQVIGQATRKHCHDGSKLLHPVVHLHIVREGKIYLQKRAMHKDIQPGKWDTAVGGHVDYGEEIEHALRREAREELGIEGFVPQHNFTYVFESTIERELVYSYRTEYAGEIRPDHDEVDEGRYWTLQEIEEGIEQGVFTPNFVHEYRKLYPIIAAELTR